MNYNRLDILKRIEEKTISSEEALQIILKNEQKLKKNPKNIVDVKDSESSNVKNRNNSVAVIGISGRFPEAKNITEFWENLKRGKNSIQKIPSERLKLELPITKRPEEDSHNLYPYGGYLSDIDLFDPLFFNISPKEAQLMDPQQRLFLEEAWKAFEDSGNFDKTLDNKKIGVFVGCKEGDYHYRYKLQEISGYYATGMHSAILSGRISYFLNLKGPSISINTACSSSLVAIHLAYESICNGTSDMAIAGGVEINTTTFFKEVLLNTGMLSPTGKCMPFDNQANGFVPGEGIGAVVLKPMEDSIKDNDHIYGIIKGSGINQDGKSSGITAPNAVSQSSLTQEVYKRYNVNPETISYIETHGTGTALGDPIEIHALTDSFRIFTSKKQYCAIGSVKANVGHAMSASGVISFIKVMLCLKHKQLVPSINCNDTNKHINFEDSPFYVNADLKEWKSSQNFLRAGISAFGLSGTNCHMIVEEAPLEKKIKKQLPFYLVIITAKKRNQLEEAVDQIIEFVKRSSHNHIGDLSYTLITGRKHFKERLACVVKDLNELINILEIWRCNGESDRILYGVLDSENLSYRNIILKSEVASLYDNLQENNPDNYIRTLLNIANSFVKGHSIEQNKLFGNAGYSIISLPTYPFAIEKYWLDNELKLFKSSVENKNKTIDDIQFSADSSIKSDLAENVMLLPTWEVFKSQSADIIPTVDENILVFGVNSSQLANLKKSYRKICQINDIVNDSIDEITRKITTYGSIDHILWISPSNYEDINEADSLQKHDSTAVLSCFRLVKAILYLGYNVKKLDWTIITQNAFIIHDENTINPSDACLHGFVGSMAKEFPNWKIRLIDVEAKSNFEISNLLAFHSDNQGNGFAYRNGVLYRQKLRQISNYLDLINDNCYRNKGVYVVIGGAGGIGEAWSEFVIKNYQASVIWIGRKIINTTIREKIERLSQGNSSIEYYSADATNYKELEQVYKKIKQSYPNIHGIIHSAIVLEDGSLMSMNEKQFTTVLSTKVDVSINMAKVFYSESLDFILFFSALNSFIKAAGQSNYVAGCTFKDAYATYLSKIVKCKVKTMNWGYWGNMGIVASDKYQEMMSQKGIASIEAPEANKAIKFLISNSINQVGFIKASEPLKISEFYTNEIVTIYPESIPSIIHHYMRDDNSDTLGISPQWSSQNDELELILYSLLEALLKSLPSSSDNSGINKVYHKWLSASHQFLMNKMDSSEIDKSEVDLERIWNTWENKKVAWSENSDLKPRITLLDETLSNIKQILKGELSVTEVMFPNSSVHLVEGVYKNNSQADYYNNLLADKLLSFILKRLEKDQNAKIKILEIGAGTGGSSQVIFQKLKPYARHIEEYCYTDISPVFLNHAKKTYGPQNPFLTYKIFNIEKPSSEQGIHSGEYDFVIASNVLHATKNIQDTLNNAKLVLKKRGLILINEVVKTSLFTHFTFGLLEGWWLSNDPEYRIEGSPLLSIKKWETAMNSAGFYSVLIPAKNAGNSELQVMIAESDGIIRNCSYKPAHKIYTTEINQISTNQQQNLAKEPFETKAFLQEFIIKNLSEVLGLEPKKISLDESFADFGLDSISGVQFVSSLNRRLEINLPSAIIFDYNCVSKLVKYLADNFANELIRNLIKHDESANPITESSSLASLSKNTTLHKESPKVERQFIDGKPDAIAIIGMSGRFTKSANVDELFENLTAGKDLIEEITHWNLKDLFASQLPENRKYCINGGHLDDIDKFDSLFFNISGLEATYMDPQQRIFLEECWIALEDSGYAGKNIENVNCGVYVGFNGGDYSNHFDESAPAQSMWGNVPATVPSRICYFLNLKGPAIAVDTACSSSLVAVHLACQSLRNKETDMSLAGGVFLQTTPNFYLAANKAGMLSQSGHCYAFDERADGFVPGDGAGVIVLKRLEQAIEDGDHIYGVICGSGINQDGTTNGITAPSGISQERLIHSVYSKFDINPEVIQLLEAHGTGTILGDPIEFNALVKAFNHFTKKKQYCALGSIKTNIGHTGAAAGIAGVIKILSCFKHQVIPPLCNYNKENSQIDMANSPFYVNKEKKNWPKISDRNRCAAISAFGYGGTNAHMVIQEPPAFEKYHDEKPAYVFFLSNRTRDGLKKQVEQFVRFCRNNSSTDLGNISFTLIVGRKHLNYRIACIAQNTNELISKLQNWLETGKDHYVLVSEYIENNLPEQPSLKIFGNECIKDCLSGKDIAKYIEHLSSIAELYTKGIELEYESLFIDGQYGRISLPTYVYSKQSYWASKSEAIRKEVSLSSSSLLDESTNSSLFLKPIWIRKELFIGNNERIRNFDLKLAIFCELKPDTSVTIPNNNQYQYIFLQSIEDSVSSRYSYYVIEVYEKLKEILSSKLKEKILVQVIIPGKNEKRLISGLSGLLKTINKENPRVFGQIIEVDTSESVEKIKDRISHDGNSFDTNICYINHERNILYLEEINIQKTIHCPYKNEGVYLVIGGMGGIGSVFAKDIAQKSPNSIIILTGRSTFNNNIKTGRVNTEYIKADVTSKQSVNKLIETILTKYGTISGIIYSAGVIKDNYLINKTKTEIIEVLAPKVSGIENLDQATRNIKLDFFAIFSAGAGVFGNAGQSDYAAANAFLDAFAGYRNSLVDSGQRYGQTLAIDWPLWENGGMKIEKNALESLKQFSGMYPMPDEEGLQAFYQGIGLNAHQLIVFYGDTHKLSQSIAHSQNKDYDTQNTHVTLTNDKVVQEKLISKVKQLFSNTIKVDSSEIYDNEPLESYGIDSIVITQMNQSLERIFEQIPKTLFYEYNTLKSLSEYLVQYYPEACAKWTGIEINRKQTENIHVQNLITPLKPVFIEKRNTQSQSKAPNIQNEVDNSIAIIGISGRFPKTNNIQDFWINLKSGTDCITQIPSDRWLLEDFFHPDMEEALRQHKSYSKSGGFIEDFSKFDSLFFNISPREAISMDPQERIFIESCWNLFEDAGYTKELIKKKYNQNVGVFVGITKTGYELNSVDPTLNIFKTNLYTSFASVANKVSYLFDLNGPSMPIDTMCSSSLIAIHEACQNINRGECELAITGGVNLYLHPSNYIKLCDFKMLSIDGKCKSFGKDANGFVPGEGVGVILLKRLSKAIEDNDNIYAIIKSSSINHGGKTSGYTVPNPAAQARVIRSALDKAGINARSVSYIEAHGTGTLLGDPIEISGLTQAFEKDTNEKQFCAIGSVKSNIGHLEAAAGISGVIKVILQMKNKQIAPSIHSKELNPNINFENTPFRVVQELAEWGRPIIRLNGIDKEYPRIAGISSFGAGGANAHVIMEEYIPSEPEKNYPVDKNNPAMIVISAKNKNQLNRKISDLLDFIENQPIFDKDIVSLAYTLQIGREAMDQRVGFLASSIQELTECLKNIVAGNHQNENIFVGRTLINRELADNFIFDYELSDAIGKWIERRKYSQILNFWVNGVNVKWENLYNAGKPKVISLPTYPFSKEPYWLTEIKNNKVNDQSSDEIQPKKNHELLLLKPNWKDNVTAVSEPVEFDSKVILFCEIASETCEVIKRKIPDAYYIDFKSIKTSIDDKFHEYSRQLLGELQQILKSKSDGKILIQLIVPNQQETVLFSGLLGMLKTAELEFSKVKSQLIIVEPDFKIEELTAMIESSYTVQGYEVVSLNGKTCFRDWEPISEQDYKIPWKDGGVYVITGGIGSLGLTFVEEIIRNTTETTIILLGRSQLNEKRSDALKKLKTRSAKIVYKQIDISDKISTTHMFNDILNKYGNITGIIHSAGLIKDNYIFSKNGEELEEVLTPKVKGLISLDEASKDADLDFFIMFSSLAGVFGNAGQVDYSAANAFLDNYAFYRNRLVAENKRKGRSLSINWPYWKNGGMIINKESEKMIESNGLYGISNETGIKAFYNAIQSDSSQILVLYGDVDRIKSKLNYSDLSSKPKNNEEFLPIDSEINDEQIEQQLKEKLAENISHILSVNSSNIDYDTNLSDYGFDSITYTEFCNNINKLYNLDLMPTIFFEKPTLNEFSSFLANTYQKKITEKLGQVQHEKNKAQQHINVPVEKTLKNSVTERIFDKANSDSIAIIGMSGKFPMASDIDEYWTNLSESKDCITEIPKERWDWKQYYGNGSKEVNKTEIIWGGFIEGVDEFDPLFFGISPREAEYMDPQQRLLLMHAWNAIEDAGYAPKDLSGSNTGVYIGTSFSDYIELVSQANLPIESFSYTGMVPSVGPSRLSYLLNLHGPCEPIETACSSSLIALHKAIESIHNGNCDMAIVGGVNTILTPKGHISFGKAGMLSKDGRCKTFSDKANGYVRGEGIGVLLIKKLEQAKLDGDHIYGTVIASGENHGGKANTLTSPNPNAQFDLLKKVYTKANLNPQTITYIETHGTGTELGDPIEINSLKKAFGELYANVLVNFNGDSKCGIGSVKSNIGHLELAAGIAGVIKVLLQFKNKTLVKSLHCVNTNPYIELKGTPFYIVKEKVDWKVLKDESGREIPRRAGISSFGFGGVNAHIVLEEYVPDHEERQYLTKNENPLIIILSAKNKRQLEVKAKQLVKWIQKGKITEVKLVNVAYTLQVGREAMDERLGIVVSSLDELHKKLNLFLEAGSESENIYYANVKKFKRISSPPSQIDSLKHLIERKNFSGILDLWTKGIDVDWNIFYKEIKPVRVSLPTYPFDNRRYWIPDNQLKIKSNQEDNKLHPLLHINHSDSSINFFSSTFSGDEFFLADHIIDGRKILPAVAYLEMAREASENLISNDSQKILCLNNIIWAEPVVENGNPLRVNIELFEEGKNTFFYKVYTPNNLGDNKTHSQGKITIKEFAPSSVIDLTKLRSQCSLKKMDATECYDYFRNLGIDYGPRHQGITEINIGKEGVLSKLSLPYQMINTQSDYVLHPAIMDSALQSTIGLLFVKNGINDNNVTDLKLSIPFALESLEIIGSCKPEMWAYSRFSNNSNEKTNVQKMDIDLCDEEGQICVSLRGYTSRILELQKSDTVKPALSSDICCYKPIWERLINKTSSVSNTETTDYIIVRSEYISIHENINDFISSAYEKTCLENNRNIIYGNIFDKAIAEGLLAKLKTYQTRKIILFHLDQNHDNENLILNFKELIKAIQKFWFKARIGLYFIYPNNNDLLWLQSFPAFVRSLLLEYNNLSFKFVQTDNESQELACQELLNEDTIDCELQISNNQILVKSLAQVDLVSDKTQLRKNGYYLITGALGGLGKILTSYLIEGWDANILAVGRSDFSKSEVNKLFHLPENSKQIQYINVDASNYNQLNGTLKQYSEEISRLNGVIHLAGCIKDGFLINKTNEEIRSVLASKINVLDNLDNITQKLKLDFFCVFSSLTSIIGNAGQADYAFANRYLDCYISRRNTLVSKEERYGSGISINWPYWKDGGMQLSEVHINKAYEKLGTKPLLTNEGLDILKKAFSLAESQIIPLKGDHGKIENVFQSIRLTGIDRETADTSSIEVKNTNKAGLNNEEQIRSKLIFLFSKILKVSTEDIDIEEDLESYGFDSIMIMDVVNSIEENFHINLDPSLIYQNKTIERLSKYLIKYGLTTVDTTNSEIKKEVRLPQMETGVRLKPNNVNDNYIAVISASCRFPGSNSPEEFWSNIISGRNNITEVPKQRWNASQLYDPELKNRDSISSKWGGFINDIDLFDSMFFNISPDDAIAMDPQQRLLLELVQHLFDRAGYSKNELKGKIVDVFLGAAETSYLKNNMDNISLASMRYMATNSIQNMIAARVSDFYDLKGSSMIVDTACSSSLVAISAACKKLIANECEMAIAGGIQLMIDSSNFIAMSRAKVISPTNKSYVFDERANGIVLGEGAGVVLLKTLSKALEDGDIISSIIISSEINNDGHTMGLTTPGIDGQKAVISQALAKSGISPDMISYYESHGTGTLLGDPIEILGATTVYRSFTNKKQFCAVGSVKANIGHLMRAAGIASFIKTSKILEEKVIPPTINCEHPHPRFNFQESAFYIPKEKTKLEGQKGAFYAAISSFGFGGTNCHVILKDFYEKDYPDYKINREPLPNTIFKRKRYWLCADVTDSAEDDFYELILKKLSEKEISVEEACELENQLLIKTTN